MLRDAVSRTANVERNGGHKWVKREAWCLSDSQRWKRFHLMQRYEVGNLERIFFPFFSGLYCVVFCRDFKPYFRDFDPVRVSWTTRIKKKDLRVMGVQLKASHKPLNTIVLWRSEGFQRGPQLALYAAKRQSLGQLYVWPLLLFQWGWLIWNQRSFFEILLNQAGIRLYLPFSD